MIRPVLAATLLAFALVAATGLRAEDKPAAEPAVPAATAPATPPAPMMGMGRPMRGGMMMGQKPCQTRMGMAGGQPPCMTGGKCQTAEAMQQRIDALEKRLDAMQLTLELLARERK